MPPFLLLPQNATWRHDTLATPVMLYGAPPSRKLQLHLQQYCTVHMLQNPAVLLQPYQATTSRHK